MGFRNPFRVTVDQETGWVLSADYGPDAGTANANRGPQGSVEYNVVPSAGNYGWPYCVRDNVQYNDYNFETSTSGAKFDCANLKNDSPNNTGLTDLPPAQPASAWMGFCDTDPRFRPNLGTGGAPMGGPRYHFDPNLDSERKFPAFYDDKWFIAEWNNGWIKTANLGPTGAMTAVDPFALGTGYRRPMDLDFGPDGALYVIEWGSGFGGDNADSGVYRVDYVAGNKAPIAEATASVTNGLAPLAVQFNSTGSSDPDGGPVTYAWDFDSNGTVDSTAANPSHTYTANGAYTAKLTVRDEGGLSGVENILITVGNRAPTVTIETPLERQARVLHGQDPVQGHGHRSGGRRPARHRLRRPHGQDLARPRRARARPVDVDRLRGDAELGPGRRPRAGGQHVHGHLGGVHRQGRSAGADRPRRGDPAAQAEAGGVLRLHRPRPGRDDRRHRGRADRDHHGRRGRWLEHRLHRGRRLHVLQAVQPDRHLRGPLPGGVAPARAARSSCATTRRPARCWARRR